MTTDKGSSLSGRTLWKNDYGFQIGLLVDRWVLSLLGGISEAGDQLETKNRWKNWTLMSFLAAHRRLIHTI